MNSLPDSAAVGSRTQRPSSRKSNALTTGPQSHPCEMIQRQTGDLYGVVVVRCVVKSKKKGEQVEVALIQSPAEFLTLASFHVPLKPFAEADFNPVVTTLSKEHPAPLPSDSAVDEVTIRHMLSSLDQTGRAGMPNAANAWNAEQV